MSEGATPAAAAATLPPGPLLDRTQKRTQKRHKIVSKRIRKGHKKDNISALAWYNAAINSTEVFPRVRALNGLGFAYFFGGGLQQNQSKAFDLFRQAAEHEVMNQ